MQRRPREKNEAHMAFIRTLPCLLCAEDTTVECCHVRMADRSVAKPMTGIATKCDDRFTLPLCGAHHRDQHTIGNEQIFWGVKGIDPVKTALALWSVTGDYERGCAIVRAVNELRAA